MKIINPFENKNDFDSNFDNQNIAWFDKIDQNNALFKGAYYLAIKRMMDLIISLILFPLAFPVFILCFLLIKIESPEDPAIFTQLRTGKGGNVFKMYKFRTMVSNAEEIKEKYATLNELQWPDFKITNDPRITRMGKFLRKSSLDELPQIINIIKNEMSLVGPRPTSFSANSYKLWQTERLDVIPGLTGLWQIIGRASSKFDDRMRLDIIYIKKRCIWLDIQIIFRTIFAVILHRGAH